VPRKRGAVVIGVNKTGDLPKLEASVSGAHKFAEWLAGEGFAVTTITDEKEPVTATAIKAAIKGFVLPGTYDQLVVYFTGHGYWKNDAELWLLTGAPEDANEAVNWKETVDFAKDCGIPNVVLISDACRSLPNSPRASRVRGSIVFPNDDIKRDRAKVDRFMAAAVGTSAYELPLIEGGSKENVFTHCLLRAFEMPDPEMVVRLQEDGKTLTIVPNRKLGPYLRREVSALLAKVDITIDQRPDDEVMSDETAYIGRAKAVADIVVPEGADIPLASARRAASRAKRRKPIASTRDDLRDIAAKALVDAIDAPLGEPSGDSRNLSLEPTGHRKFDDAFSTARNEASDIKHFATETGFAVIGVRVQEAVILGGFLAAPLTKGDGAGEPALIRIDSPQSASTVVVEFENGSGAALAALRGYIGHVVVDQGNVVSINYVPSENNTRFAAFASRRAQLQRLRAAAAAAIRFGVFRIDDQVAARKLADLIRVEKSVDPSLGLYAAYAYSEGDSREELASVASYMHDDLNADLFDVAMLARRQIAIGGPTSLTVPFCPMLTQGWNLLRAREIELPPVLEAAQDDLQRAVWTTFRPERVQKIFKAIENGDLK
jgi:hypothetical protein